jgi:hypothetical protein
MADFGLAAQIGRGNAMPGAQPQDQTNRMMQLMQLQQLQQNMMLAREQNAREAALAPLRKGQIEASTQADLSLIPGREAQGNITKLELDERRTAQRTYQGVLGVMDGIAKGTFNPADPAAFRDLPTAVRLSVQEQLAKSKATADAAKKAGLEMGSVERAVTYDLLDRAGEGITGPREYAIYRDKILKVEPSAADLLPRDYNPRNAQQLRDFVGDRKRVTELVGGVPTVGLAGSPIRREVGVERFLPAGVVPPTQAQIGALAPSLGGTPATQAMGLDPTRMAAGTPADVGAMQSGVPGQRLPVAGEANFQSLASAGGPIPASQAIAEQAKAKSTAVKMEALPKVQSAYKGAIDAVDKELRAIEEIKSRPFGTAMTTGPIFGRLPNVAPFDITGAAGAQARIDTLKSGATLNALTELRRNSPTGAALSSTSDADIRLLTTSTGALSEVQSTEDFMTAIANRERDLLLTKRRLGEAYANDYGAPPKVEGGPLSKEPVRSGDTSVLLSNGKTLIFPSKDAVDAYMKKAGM